MNSKDIFTIKDASKFLGLNINTLRYWLKKNSDDCEKGIYETRLFNLLAKVFVTSKNNRYTRSYERYIILDMDEFQNEFKKYEEFLIENKKRKRKHNLGWSRAAIECYERHLMCKGCIYEKICASISKKHDNIPPMKKSVLKLLTELGFPPKI